ncbi:hypothetical protein WA026_022214 [Henosepilachna vigintioctopunctata]|uniref:Uncharacterized protein n=1 Tax=Henosepilachna vigintioctopunctata TaxID=420089 RepID=A0AAW1URJ3_9CUCU
MLLPVDYEQLNCVSKSLDVKIIIDGDIVCERVETAKHFSSHFSQSANTLISQCFGSNLSLQPNCVTYLECPIFISALDVEDIINVMNGLKSTNSTSPYGMSSKLIKLIVNVVSLPSNYLVNRSLMDLEFSAPFKDGSCYSSIRKGESSNCGQLQTYSFVD